MSYLSPIPTLRQQYTHPLRAHLYHIGHNSLQLSCRERTYNRPHYTQASTSDTQHNLRTSYWQNPIGHRSRPMHKRCHTHGTGRGESHPTIPPSLPGLRSPSKSKYTLKVPNRPAVHISRRLMPNDARHGSKAREGGHGSVAQRPRRP